MDLLGGYSSEEEENKESLSSDTKHNPSFVNPMSLGFSSASSSIPASIPAAGKEESTNTNTAVAGRRRLRRKLDVSVLPKHIQDLLTKGVSAADSDNSDGDSDLKSSKPAAFHQRSRGAGNDLMSLLPKPLAKESTSTSMSLSSTPIITTRKEIEEPTHNPGLKALPEDFFELGKPEAAARMEAEAPKWTSPSPSAPSASSDVLPSFQMLLPKKSSAPAVSIPNALPAFPSSSSSNPVMTAPSKVVSSEFRHGEDRKRSRKSEREVELSLLQGDLSKLGDAKIVDVAGNQPWNSTQYDDRRKKGEFMSQLHSKMLEKSLT